MVLRLAPQGVTVAGDAVMDDAGAVRHRDAGFLRRRDRRHGQVGEAGEEQRPVALVHAPMHGRQAAASPRAEHGRMRELAVAMDDVERVEAAGKRFHLERFQGRRHPRSHPALTGLQGGETEMISDPWYICHTVRRGEERYLNLQVSQCYAEIMDDALRPAMMRRRGRKDVGCDLRDTDHGLFLCFRYESRHFIRG